MTVLNRNGQSGKSSQNKEVTQVLLIVMISWIKKWFCVHKCVLIMGKKKPKKNKEQRKTKEKQRK